jgi:HPt (histidine-containing phosphotransfer) domain-containing protein
MSDTNPTPHVLDMDVIAGLKELGGEDDPSLFLELVEIFLKDSERQLASLQEALKTQDVKKLECVAHTLKSSCANLGAVELSRLCFELEKRGRSASFEGVGELLKHTDAAYATVRRELERLRD